MDYYYRIDRQMRDNMLAKWIRADKEWRTCKTHVVILVVCAVALFFVPYIFYGITSTPQELANKGLAPLGKGLYFCIIPVLSAAIVYSKGKKNRGQPYSKRENEYLYIDDLSIQYGYHDKDSNVAESRMVYKITYQNVMKISFNEEFQIATITGIYDLTSDGESLGLRTYVDSTFSFLYCFEQKDAFIRLLNEKRPKFDWEDQNQPV